MFETYAFSARAPRVRVNRLSLCLAVALASQMSAEAALAAPWAAPPRAAIEHRGVAAKNTPDHPAASPWTVKNCYDHGTDSLRDIIQNQAQSGDTVDLSQLPMLCSATDSKITLTTGEIAIAQNDLTLQGPDPADGTVTVSGGGALRVFDHQGFGTLSVRSLKITDGFYHAAGSAFGGCVKSSGSVYLGTTVVSGCTASSDTANAEGGGVYSTHDITLVNSTLSGNQANAGSGQGKIHGAGLHASGNLTMKYSSISDNVAQTHVGQASGAGAAYVVKTSTIFASTIDNNEASSWSAIASRGSVYIFDSTISENVAADGTYALNTDGDSLTISNSTVAFNHSSVSGGAAVRFQGPLANSPLTLQSSIIADNTAGATNEPADLLLASGHGILSGADNLVMASNVSDPNVITVTTDPKLGQLQFNGGPTRTHMLLPGSPALGKGNENGLPAWMSNDQRGFGYPRTTGAMLSVDMGAVQFDTIFVGSFDSQ
jgi:hypothetical protein